mgnify:FL=1|jgi:uncharacterized UPF0160 family protein
MTKQELKEYCVNTIESIPEIYDEVYDFYEMACDDILNGKSEYQACELAVNSIDELIEEL